MGRWFVLCGFVLFVITACGDSDNPNSVNLSESNLQNNYSDLNQFKKNSAGFKPVNNCIDENCEIKNDAPPPEIQCQTGYKICNDERSPFFGAPQVEEK